MATYVDEIIEKLKEVSLETSAINIARGLRSMLGDEKIGKLFREMLESNNTISSDERVKNGDEYNYYWLAVKLKEIDEAEEAEDGLKYPSHGWINGEMWEALDNVSKQLNTLNGVYASKGVVYPEGSCYRSKGFWTIDFDTIEDFNHFLWAGCYRYLPLAKSEKWRILPNLGDPDYREKRLRFELHYMKLNANKSDMEKDFADMAKCIEDYSNDENEIKNKLEKR